MHKRIARLRDHLSLFVTAHDVPATSKVSERHLRPSMTLRKVINDFRFEWGVVPCAAFRFLSVAIVSCAVA